MLWSHENAKKILDRLCEKPSVIGASRAILGSKSKIIWIWARQSAADKAAKFLDSKYILYRWPDDDDDCRPIWFHEAMELSRKIHALNLDADSRENLSGIERPVIESGRFQYVIDPLAVAKFDNKQEAEDFGGYTDWPYAHDERGARIVLTVKEQVPAQVKIAGLKALMGEIWNVPERREIDTQITGGVMVLGGSDAHRNNDSPLRRDLMAELENIRKNGPKNKPDAPVEIFKDLRTIDQADDVPDRAPALPPPPKPNRRIYYEEPTRPLVLHPPEPSYARPQPLDTGGTGSNPVPPPGGFKVS